MTSPDAPPLLLAERSIEIHRPAASAWAYAADLRHFADWFPGVLRIRADGHGDGGLPRFVETVRLPLRGERVVRIAVVALEPPSRLVTEGRLPPLWPRMEIRVEPLGDGACRVHWRMASRSRRQLVRWLLVPLAARLMRRRSALGLARLKSLLEAQREACTD